MNVIRFLPFPALAFVAIQASAESYVAEIYSVPPNYKGMKVTGAGDNGMMTGTHTNNWGLGASGKAIYRTFFGSKDLHPAGWMMSGIEDSWGGTYHCGVGLFDGVSNYHALFWVGGGVPVDLHPAGSEYGGSWAMGGGGQLQVGFVTPVGGNEFPCAQCGFNSPTNHAGVWSRTAASFRRLHSTTHENSTAVATDGANMVGWGFRRPSSLMEALIWTGSNQMAISLHQPGWTASRAFSVWGNQSVGYYTTLPDRTDEQAVLWNGTSGGFVNLHPALAFSTTEALVVKNGVQAGSGVPITTPGRRQAIAWHGAASTWINLHARLPYPFNLWSSQATGIDGQGNIVGHVQGMGPNGSESRPVLWRRSN